MRIKTVFNMVYSDLNALFLDNMHFSFSLMLISFLLCSALTGWFPPPLFMCYVGVCLLAARFHAQSSVFGRRERERDNGAFTAHFPVETQNPRGVHIVQQKRWREKNEPKNKNRRSFRITLEYEIVTPNML